VAAIQLQSSDAHTSIRRLLSVMTSGPWELDIASAIITLAAAAGWYGEAVQTARHTLSAQPRLLARLSLNESVFRARGKPSRWRLS
jgi:hypothetical protein